MKYCVLEVCQFQFAISSLGFLSNKIYSEKQILLHNLGRDEKGCQDGAICIRLEKKQWGDDKGSNCPGYCPPGDCKATSYLCPDDFPGRDRFDICDGCPLEKICVEPAKDKNGNISNVCQGKKLCRNNLQVVKEPLFLTKVVF